MTAEWYEYDEIGDVLDVYFTENSPAWTIEVTPNIMISINRTTQAAVRLTLMDYTELLRPTEAGSRSFPVTGLAALPRQERALVLAILTTPPVNRWLHVSTVQMLPDSPVTVTHVEPPPQTLMPLLQMIGSA